MCDKKVLLKCNNLQYRYLNVWSMETLLSRSSSSKSNVCVMESTPKQCIETFLYGVKSQFLASSLFWSNPKYFLQAGAPTVPFAPPPPPWPPPSFLVCVSPVVSGWCWCGTWDMPGSSPRRRAGTSLPPHYEWLASIHSVGYNLKSKLHHT